MANPLTTNNEFRLSGGPYDGKHIKPDKQADIVYCHGDMGWVIYAFKDGSYQWAPNYTIAYAFAR